MDLLQDQVTSLDVKVDALHQMIGQLSNQITQILSELKAVKADRDHLSQSGMDGGRYSYQGRNSLESSMEHKDVLLDVNYADSESQSGERILAPEVQIQRLTAQLTAAYNRIAALEEQLLAKRIH
jgi:regulator of replication initiation timing